jgi:hypothetical protein
MPPSNRRQKGLSVAFRKIRMSTAMTNAILAGQKTQTRRQVAGQWQNRITDPADIHFDCVYGKVGDYLRVVHPVMGRAKGRVGPVEFYEYRLTAQITDMRIERIQDLSNHDARAMGMRPSAGVTPRKAFVDHWDTRAEWQNIHSEWEREWNINNNTYRWEFNPWVWVITFRLFEIPEHSPAP